MHGSSRGVIVALWVVFAAYWILTASSTKPTKKAEASVTRVTHRLLLWAAYVLVLPNGVNAGFLARRFLPSSPILEFAGVVITAAGVAFAIWARHELGANWSATVTLKQGHELVCTGPYAVVRNPIYTGMVLAVLGTAINAGEVHGLLGVACAAAGVSLKIRLEERLLAEEFGSVFAEYKRRVRAALIPFVI
jgi:protein-S-isoprenylcysteine O-methyltransferase Ste14